MNNNNKINLKKNNSNNNMNNSNNMNNNNMNNNNIENANIECHHFSIATTHRGLNQKEFDEEYNKVQHTNLSCRQRLKKTFQCSGSGFKSHLAHIFPFISFLASYKLKSYFFRDLFAGISIGFMGVPQSLGYARIAKVPEMMGLYTSIFPVFIYFFFTSSKHVSIGTLAIVSLVIRSSIESLTLPSQSILDSANQTLLNNATFMQNLKEQDEAAVVLFSVSYCCVGSVILIIMSFLRLGFVVSFMSDAFISAFLSAIILRIFVFQYKDMLSIQPLTKHSGALEFVFNSYEIFIQSHHANLISVVMGIITLNILILFKFYLNDFFRKKFKFPIPIEIIVVVVAIFCNRLIGLEEIYNVEILSSIKTGIPQIIMPSPALMYNHVFEAFLGAIISFLMVGMMSKLFASNYGYEVDNNQEMFALGVSGLFGCFFSIIFPSASPARCFLMESTGGKTQACHLFTAAFSLFTMLVFASFMRDLPVCVLSSIIASALIPLTKYFLDPIQFYKSNKYDLMIWLVTFSSTLVFSVKEGMIIGLAFSVILVHVWMLKESKGRSLRKFSNGMFLDRELYAENKENILKEMGGRLREEMEEKIEGEMRKTIENGDIVVFKFEAPIFFSTLDTFRSLLFNKIPSPTILKQQNIHVEKVGKKKLKEKKQNNKTNGMPKEDNHVTSYDITKNQNASIHLQEYSPSDMDTDDELFLKADQPLNLKCVVLDCSAVTLMDTQAAKSIAFLHQEYKKHGVVLMLAACNQDLLHLLRQVNEWREILPHHLYPSVANAFIASYVIYSTSTVI